MKQLVILSTIVISILYVLMLALTLVREDSNTDLFLWWLFAIACTLSIKAVLLRYDK